MCLLFFDFVPLFSHNMGRLCVLCFVMVLLVFFLVSFRMVWSISVSKCNVVMVVMCGSRG